MDRNKFTQQLWQQMPPAIQESRTVDQVIEEWWHDPRPDGGWRLSWSGYVDLLNVLEIEHWQFDFATDSIAPWMLLKLKHHVTTPYYIVHNRKQTSITVTDSKLSLMINLYGNLERWIKSLN